MEAAPAVVTRQELETRVWGEELPDSIPCACTSTACVR